LDIGLDGLANQSNTLNRKASRGCPGPEKLSMGEGASSSNNESIDSSVGTGGGLDQGSGSLSIRHEEQSEEDDGDPDATPDATETGECDDKLPKLTLLLKG